MRQNRFPPGWGEERVQEGLYQSVAVLLNEGKETLALAATQDSIDRDRELQSLSRKGSSGAGLDAMRKNP